MKFKIKHLLELSPSIKKLLGDQTLSGPLTYKVAKLLRPIKTELKEIDTVREKIFLNYTEKDEAGTPKFDERNQPVIKDFTGANKEWNEFLDTETDDIPIVPVKLKDTDIPKSLSPDDVLDLEAFITITEIAEVKKDGK